MLEKWSPRTPSGPAPLRRQESPVMALGDPEPGYLASWAQTQSQAIWISNEGAVCMGAAWGRPKGRRQGDESPEALPSGLASGT